MIQNVLDYQRKPFNELKNLIQNHTGIRINANQEKRIIDFIQKEASFQNICNEEVCKQIFASPNLFNKLISIITTNETYFFREEKQFKVLKEQIFPKYVGKTLKIWSAACASGEEPLSLFALAKNCGISAKIYASDINIDQISLFKKGIYQKSSFCNDGYMFKNLLLENNFGTFQNDVFYVNQDILSSIKTKEINLIKDNFNDFFHEKLDLVFLRNVFIYFNEENRYNILKKIIPLLSNDGMIFLSINEIGCINQDLLPKELKKINYGQVYFLVRSEVDNFISCKKNIKKMNSSIKNEEKSIFVSNTNQDNKVEAAKVESSVEIRKSIQEVFTDISNLLGQGKFDKAKELAYDFVPFLNEKAYDAFMKGYVEKYCGNVEKAEQFFIKAESLYPSLWPTYFYHGLLLREQNKNDLAIKKFYKCLELLDSYATTETHEFDFLIESFSSEYFYKLCLKFIKKEDDNGNK